MALAFGRWGAFFASEANSTSVRINGIRAKPKTLLQPKRCSQHRGDQCREHGAGVTRTGNAHGFALMLRRIPLRRQWQGHGKRRAGHTEEQTQYQRLFVAMNAKFPGAEQCADHDDLADQTGSFW